jgi:hypothetical protein
MRRVFVIVLITHCSLTVVVSQSSTSSSDSLLAYLQFEDPSPLSCLYTYFPPFFIQHGIELKSFIRSKTFRRIRAQFGDLRAVDAIYVRAMQMTNNNTAMALLLSSIACFDHRLVGINVPVLSLYFPLSNESEEEFARRVKRLPTHLYDDSPNNEQGDRDKLQHFFGSAFLAFVFESGDVSMRFGEFVEKGEGAFIIGGINDDRDLMADRQGQDFGVAVLDNNRRFPSKFLKTPVSSTNKERETTLMNDVPLCAGVW